VPWRHVAIAAVVATIIWLVGVGPFLLVQLPIILLAASAGVWLFYVQHQFENTKWARDGTWNLQDVALHGSSHYALQACCAGSRPISGFITSIICAAESRYRLPLVLRDHPELHGIGRLTLLQSLRCVRLVLWDEGQQRLVSFRDVHQHIERASHGWPTSAT
jgi:acyl-lipid omega-6 desaturase (Delta-12 desaturase)